MSTTKLKRRPLLSRLFATLLGALAIVIALPAATASADPLWPGGPDLPWLQLPKQTPPKKKPAKPTQKKPAPTTETKAPESPKPPVATKTGWVALADDATHQMTVWHNGEVVRTMPISMGTNKNPTPNGVYNTMEKYREMWMDSSTYGVPVNSPEGYRTYVEHAIRMSWSGIFLHGAPWSVAQQGVSNASHGCININPENAKWAYNNFPTGTPIVVRGTVGGQYVPGS